eukprot:10867846-Alexandrium_andersonii.AAC.1
MSASLVGSEMCIRDSSRGACNLARARRLSSPPVVPQPCEAQQPCVRWAAVSYTHLTLPTICSV